MSAIADSSRVALQEAAGKLLGSAIEVNKGRSKLDDRVIQALANLIVSTAELLSSARAPTGKVAITLAEKAMKQLQLTGHQAAECGGALAGLSAAIAQAVLYGTPAGPMGWTLAAIFALNDAFAVYGECYLPAAESYAIAEAEARMAAKLRARRAASRPAATRSDTAASHDPLLILLKNGALSTPARP